MKNKTEKKSNKLPVALYIKYEEGNLDKIKKKEEILTKYCEEKNYDIVKKYFDISEYTGYYFTNNMRGLLRNIGSRNYDLLLVCDFEELSENIVQLMAICAVLDDEDVIIETLNQGVIGEDMLLGGNYFFNVLNKEELRRPRIEYDDNGNLVDTEEDPF